MGPMRIRMVLAGWGLVLGIILLVLLLGPGRFRRSQGAAASPQQAGPSAASPMRPSPAGAPPVAGDGGRSELADGLNSPAGGVRADLRIIDNIFNAYRSALRSGNPIGENAEITAALSGRNRLGFAFLPADCPAINAKGELCDRWGTPYFFHQLSGEKMEIRSAGPDHQLWTADDEVLTP